MLDTDLAYLAGAMDSDGYFTIKKSTYKKRVCKDAHNAVYSEKIGLSQVTPQIPELLQKHFKGSMYLAASKIPNRRSMYRWTATDLNAAKACELLLPYLRIKVEQAKAILELRDSKSMSRSQLAYWFQKEHLDWQKYELITTSEVMELMGYSNRGSVSQAVRNGVLLSLPYTHEAVEKPRVPKLLVLQAAELAKQSKDGRVRNQPEQLIACRERLWLNVRELNKMGVNGTPVYHRTGPYKPAE